MAELMFGQLSLSRRRHVGTVLQKDHRPNRHERARRNSAVPRSACSNRRDEIVLHELLT